MIEKNYYRMGELKDRFGFSDIDYRYLCENFKAPLFAYAYYHYFLIAERVPKSRTRIVKGVVCYQGAIELTIWDRKTLLRDGLVNLKTCYLNDFKGIKFMESSSDILINDIITGEFEQKQVMNFSELDLDNSDAILIGDENREFIQTEDIPLRKPIELTFSDLILRKGDIDWCLYQLGLSQRSENSRTNLMHQQVKQIMKIYPALGATELFRLIVDNFNKDIDDTDPLALWLEANYDVIEWGKPGKKEKPLTLANFRNLHSKFRKN